MNSSKIQTVLKSVIVLGMLAGILSACSAPEEKTGVLSLQTDSAATTPTGTGTAESKPVSGGQVKIMRGDSPEKVDNYYATYIACIGQHGVPLTAKGGSTFEGMRNGASDPPLEVEPGADPHLKDALAACASLYPVQMWERNANNPEREQFVHKMILCLQREGIRVEEGGPKMAYKFSPDQVQDEAFRAGTDKCETEVYG
ncbi:hypothetical protein GCM10023063_46830 [Arthrobacter methylotrophus]|uniref:Lipoprotein n=1 Tax=Arthrobacter methylotrophus TaxID=121291 RepID=A0ABV5UVI3_9MICC